MAAKTGEKLVFDEVGVEVIVTSGGEGDVSVAAADEPLKVGKRYSCDATGIQVLVTKPGKASLSCGGAPMALQEPKKTKAAD